MLSLAFLKTPLHHHTPPRAANHTVTSPNVYLWILTLATQTRDEFLALKNLSKDQILLMG